MADLRVNSWDQKDYLLLLWQRFVVGSIYKIFVLNAILQFKMPEQVPPNLSQTILKDNYSICFFNDHYLVIWLSFRMVTGICFAKGVIQVFQPLFSAADGYVGLALIYGAMSLFWFIGRSWTINCRASNFSSVSFKYVYQFSCCSSRTTCWQSF